MPTPEGLPETLGEYLTVWCADLFEPLSEADRESFIQAGCMAYEGGPWMSRECIQRHAEYVAGLHTEQAFDALTDLAIYGGITAVIDRLDGDARPYTIKLLSHLPATPELVAEVDAARDRGQLTDAERSAILTSACAQPIPPDLIPLPAHLPPLPADYPESYAEWRRRDPPYEQEPTPLTGRRSRRVHKAWVKFRRHQITPEQYHAIERKAYAREERRQAKKARGRSAT